MAIPLSVNYETASGVRRANQQSVKQQASMKAALGRIEIGVLFWFTGKYVLKYKRHIQDAVMHCKGMLGHHIHSQSEILFTELTQLLWSFQCFVKLGNSMRIPHTQTSPIMGVQIPGK